MTRQLLSRAAAVIPSNQDICWIYNWGTDETFLTPSLTMEFEIMSLNFKQARMLP